jgi:hypothetical protein
MDPLDGKASGVFSCLMEAVYSVVETRFAKCSVARVARGIQLSLSPVTASVSV